MSFGERRPVRRELVATAWKKLCPQIKRRDTFRCQVCGTGEQYHLSATGRRMSNLVVGHRVPPERYPGSHNDPGNLWTLCRRCNSSQANRTVDEWRAAASGRLVELGLSRPPSKRSAVITGDYTRRKHGG